MVLFDESPVTLIRETTNQFHIAPDRDSLLRITDSLSTLSTARSTRLTQHSSQLKSLSRKLASLEEGHRWEEDRHDAGGHAERMLRMDTEKFRVAKEVSNVAFEGERLEGELAGLRGVEAGLVREGVEGGSHGGAAAGGVGRRRGGAGVGSESEGGEDEVVLKLHLYRSLNITATQDPQTGAFTRAVVTRPRPQSQNPQGGSNLASRISSTDDNDDKADVSIIDLEPHVSRASYATRLWDAL